MVPIWPYGPVYSHIWPYMALGRTVPPQEARPAMTDLRIR